MNNSMVYKIRMRKDDYFKISNKIISSNLTILDDDVTFEIEGGSYNILKRTNYEFKVIESLQSKILRFFSHYGLLITGVMFLLSVLYMNIYRVSKVEFNRETPINDEIEYRIKSSFKTLFCFQFCNIDYNEFSKSMCKTYFEYPYINVSRKNNTIYVYVAEVDEASRTNQTELDGNIVAKKDGVVDVYYTYAGKSLVSKNKYVRKGDILIEGNDKVSGLVMATTYEKLDISIPKRNKVEQYTSERQKYTNCKLFGWTFDLGKKQSYELYEENEKLIFNLFDIFSLKKIEHMKKNVIIKTYQQEEALALAKEKIKEDFAVHQTNDLEELIAITNTKMNEAEDEFQFTFILKKYESIGAFSPRE